MSGVNADRLVERDSGTFSAPNHLLGGCNGTELHGVGPLAQSNIEN